MATRLCRPVYNPPPLSSILGHHPPVHVLQFRLSHVSRCNRAISYVVFLSFSFPSPGEHNYAILGSRSSFIRSTCSAHFNRLFTNLPIKHFCVPTSSLRSSILLRSTIFTPAIRLNQLFSHTCSLCWCFSDTGNVSRPYNIAGVTRAPSTFPFNFYEMCLSYMPRTCFHVFAPACTLLLTSVSDRPSLLTAPPVSSDGRSEREVRRRVQALS